MKKYKKFFETNKNNLNENIISTKEFALDMDGNTIRPGDIVYHYKFGKGQIVRIDTKTYSIPMVIFDSYSAKEEVYRDAKEFSKFKIR